MGARLSENDLQETSNMGDEVHWETLPTLQGKRLMENAGKYPKDVRFARQRVSL